MTVFEIIKQLAKKQGKSLNDVEQELGLSKNVLYRMKHSDNPTKDRLETLADYFNVSTDYLLGRTDNPNTQEKQYTETDLEKMLDNAMSYSGKPMSEHDREVIKAFLKGKYGI